MTSFNPYQDLSNAVISLLPSTASIDVQIAVAMTACLFATAGVIAVLGGITHLFTR